MGSVTYKNAYEKARAWLNRYIGDRRMLYAGLFVFAVAIVLAVTAAVSAFGARNEATGPLSATKITAEAATEEASKPQEPAESTAPVTNETTDTTLHVTERQGEVSTELRVNGEDVEVPQEGHVRKEINTDNGNVKVDLNVRSNESGDTRSKSSVDVNIQSSSSSVLRSE